jgi:hypothetical protein
MQSDPDIVHLLARAFDRAWTRYYVPGRVTISPLEARPALANHLVELAKAGTLEEDVLAEGGLLYLVSLVSETPDISA